MVKTRAKGYRTVQKCKFWLEERGYLVDDVEKSGKFRRDKDLFNLFDLVAVHRHKPVMFIQCKTNKPGGLTKYKIFSRKYSSRRSFPRI